MRDDHLNLIAIAGPMTGIHSDSHPRYPQGMPPANPIVPVARRIPIRLLRLLWIGLATVVLVMAGIALSIWLAWHREQQVMREINGWGASVLTGYGGPAWLQQFVGNRRMMEFKFFDRITYVDLEYTKAADTEMARLSRLTNLESLFLNDTKVTDAGLPHLSNLANLETLSLEGTEVTDTGLAQLRGLTKLRFLYLAGTTITEKGIEQLKAALPGCEIDNIARRNVLGRLQTM